MVRKFEGSTRRGCDRFVEVLDVRLRESEARVFAEIQAVRTEIHKVRGDLLRDQRELMLRFAALVSLIALVTARW